MEDYTINKYLPDIITKSSNLFIEFKKEYTKDEIFNLDLRKYLKNIENLPKNSKSMALMIHHLISYVMCDLIDDYVKSMIHNLFYLQIIDVLDLIEVITRKRLFNVYANYEI